MATSAPTAVFSGPPAPGAVLELLKPVTWFPPMWAFGCGVVAAGPWHGLGDGRWWLLVAGILLAGPLVCGNSQAINDWFDRHVDAINEPQRPIPSGRVPGRWGLAIAIAGTILSLLVSTSLGPWGVLAAVVGIVLAWAYSAPPFRLKANGWYGNAAVGLCYEGLPWFTGIVVMTGTAPTPLCLAILLLYSAGAHGIMTLNDFKALDGDRQMGVRSLPVQLGPERAARVACWVMALPQVAVILLLVEAGRPVHALGITASLLLQGMAMDKMLGDPRKYAPWYNATGVSLYVLGMLCAAFALRSLGGAA